MTVPVAGRGPQVAAVSGLFLALSTLAVAARCYCRAFIVKSFGVDDWFAVIAWVFFVFFTAFAIAGTHHGTGQHASLLPPTEIPIGLKWWWACEPVYVLSNMALKFSIAIFLLRIAVARVHKVIIWSTVAVLEIYGAFYFFLFVLQCRPSAYFWTKYTGGKGTCIDPKVTVDATYAYSAVSCVADWILGIIPIFLVWNLQMNPRTKVVVALILAVGAIASTATIIRIPYVHDLANIADFLYATTDVALWSITETGIGITASCVATLRPLFRSFFARSHLMGNSTSLTPNSKPWAPNGYVRQGDGRGTPGSEAGNANGNGGAGGSGGGGGSANAKSHFTASDEEMELRNDIGRERGVTTFVGSRGEKGRGLRSWDDGGAQFVEGSSDDETDWNANAQTTRREIRKTVVTRVA